MNDLSEKTVFDLANRMNQINREIMNLELERNRVVRELNREIMNLELEYNGVVQELHVRIPKLKDDVDIQPKVLRKVMDEQWIKKD